MAFPSVNCINDRNALLQQVKPFHYPSRFAILRKKVKLNNAYTKVIYKRYLNMNYSAEKLAVIFGCTVSDIMDINKEILFEQVRTQCLFNKGEMVTQFFANLKTEDFGLWVKLNRNFWMEAKRELKKRYKRDYKDLRAKYWRLADILKETNGLFYDEWLDINDAMKDVFSKMVKFERTLLLFNVVSLKNPNYEIFMWHMQLYKDDYDPIAILEINSQEDEDAYKWKLPFRYEDELTDAEYYLEFLA
jgi:hypothetical protein